MTDLVADLHEQVQGWRVDAEAYRMERDRLREALERIASIADPYLAQIAREALS